MEEKQISITLKVSVWNSVLAILASGRYSEVAPIITMIQEQGSSQIKEFELTQRVKE